MDNEDHTVESSFFSIGTQTMVTRTKDSSSQYKDPTARTVGTQTSFPMADAQIQTDFTCSQNAFNYSIEEDPNITISGTSIHTASFDTVYTLDKNLFKGSKITVEQLSKNVIFLRQQNNVISIRGKNVD